MSPGFFVHPVSDPAVMAGNGTIGLEILEDLPDVGHDPGPVRRRRPRLRDRVRRIADAARRRRSTPARSRARRRFAASLAAGEPVEAAYSPSFVDGIGARTLLAEMWPIAKQMLAGSLVVTTAEAAAAVRTLVERARVVAEGAGATPVAAALTGKGGSGKIVCVVSGGNIDAGKLAEILTN